MDYNKHGILEIKAKKIFDSLDEGETDDWGATDFFIAGYKAAYVSAELTIGELNHRIEFWQNSNNSNYENWKARNYEYQELQKEVEYWKARFEAAEAVIVSMECGITKLPNREAELNHESAYNNWIELKNKKYDS